MENLLKMQFKPLTVAAFNGKKMNWQGGRCERKKLYDGKRGTVVFYFALSFYAMNIGRCSVCCIVPL